jgi:acyl carrier protein
LINNYGPSETTVVATSGIVPDNAHPQRPPAIGRPIDHARIYLLDEQGQPVPSGSPGEVFIGGRGVARGYHHRPELTAERFLPDPFADDPDARMYRTGDRAQWLPDGQLAFLGRIDAQVKIRGYRIELDEIAAVLNNAPAVKQSVVAVDQPENGEPQLVAYVALAPDATPQLSALQQHLGQTLPDYMIPATFVHLDTLPMTANGKIDRAALPKPDAANQLRDAVAVPTTPIEIRLTAIIRELLHIETIGINDNFFLLGGHSLLGAQLLAQISQAYGVKLPLHQLFVTPTIRELSTCIEQKLAQTIADMSDAEIARLLQQQS